MDRKTPENMIKVKHPDDSRNRSQEDFLARCPDEDRRYHALMFTYGNIVYRYHQGSTELHLTEEDFQEWLEGLPDDVKPKMKKLGFHRCKSMLSFKRYVMEKNDIGLSEYVRRLMDEDDYQAYLRMVSGDG